MWIIKLIFASSIWCMVYLVQNNDHVGEKLKYFSLCKWRSEEDEDLEEVLWYILMLWYFETKQDNCHFLLSPIITAGIIARHQEVCQYSWQHCQIKNGHPPIKCFLNNLNIWIYSNIWVNIRIYSNIWVNIRIYLIFKITIKLNTNIFDIRNYNEIEYKYLFEA